jgi:DNA-binding IclR family transcriptional regulator
LLSEIRRRQPDLWRRAERPFGKALEGYARTGYVLNADTFFNGLTTVAVPLGGPDENRLYILYCSCLTTVLGTDKLRRGLGAELLSTARQLAPVIARGPAREKGARK